MSEENISQDSSVPYVEVTGIRKNFKLGSHVVEVLKGVSFTVNRGEWIALLGASGSGKTTLLDIIGSISHPDSGEVKIDGRRISSQSSGKQVEFRRKNIGFVFQAYHILPELSILENVMLPALLDGMSAACCRQKAASLLEMTGLAHRMKHRPNELSGGEQQRAAIARALMNDPKLILADEPTGNLDSATGQTILDLFIRIREQLDTTIIMVTHDRSVAALADRIVELRDGMIHTESDGKSGTDTDEKQEAGEENLK